MADSDKDLEETSGEKPAPDSGEDPTQMKEPAQRQVGEQAREPDGESDPSSPGKKSRGFIAGAAVAGVVMAGTVTAGVIFHQPIAQMLGLSTPDAGAGETDRLAMLETKLKVLEEKGQRNEDAARSLAADLQSGTQRLDDLSRTLGHLSQRDREERLDVSGQDLMDQQDGARAMLDALSQRLDAFEAVSGERGTMEASDTNPGQQMQQAAELSDMQETLADLDARFSAMDQSLEQTGGRIEALEETAPPENLEEILQSLAPHDALGALSQRLQIIEDADPQGAARAAVLALSATELARAAATSQAFESELEAFMALAPGNAIGQALGGFAASGTPTKKVLLLEFGPTARAIAEAERVREDGGAWSWFINQITALFSIRKVGELDGGDWQAVLARAENRIAAEDVNAAAMEISALEGAAARGAASWLERVEARRTVDGLISGLTASVFSDLLTALESE